MLCGDTEVVGGGKMRQGPLACNRKFGGAFYFLQAERLVRTALPNRRGRRAEGSSGFSHHTNYLLLPYTTLVICRQTA
jgi:hypothetical protein